MSWQSVARGGASRQGLKLQQIPAHTHACVGGSWRGFPPGIETSKARKPVDIGLGVARGGASRQGLKLRARSLALLRPLVARGGASRQGLKLLKEGRFKTRFEVARGGASRQGLKHERLDQGRQIDFVVARGGASRLGLKPINRTIAKSECCTWLVEGLPARD